MIADYPWSGARAVGGPQIGATRLVRALADRGVEVIVVAPAPGNPAERTIELQERVTLVAVPAEKRWSLLTGLRLWRHRVRAVVRAADPHLVHGQGVIPGGIATADVWWLPRVFTARGNASADTAAAYGRLRGAARAYLRDGIAGTAVERADVVIGVNPDWRVNLPRQPRRFVYIPNIVDGRFFALNRQPEPGSVLFAGGARAIKGWPLLAAAWPSVREAIPEAHLHLVGWSEENAPPRVDPSHKATLSVEPWLSPEELGTRMARASALVIPSQFEVSPTILAEAWALGVPVVATAVGGLRALAEGAGVVIHKRDPDALAAGIVRALAGGNEIDGLVEEGRRRAEAHRVEAVAQAHLALYTELVQQGGG